MKLKKVIQTIEKVCPPHLADFDYVGLLLGDPTQEIKKVGVALNCSYKALMPAVKLGCDLLIVHHAPQKMNTLSNSQTSLLASEKIRLCQKNNLAIYRGHNHFDFAKDGVINSLCQLMGFSVQSVEVSYQGRKIKGGVYLSTEKLTFEEIIQRIKKLNPVTIRVAGPKKDYYQRIAISSGGGFKAEFYEQLKCDAYIAGEIRHTHEVYIGEDLGITLFEMTHYTSENEPLKRLSQKFGKILAPFQVELIFIDVGESLHLVT